jgi:hypothetical protein
MKKCMVLLGLMLVVLLIVGGCAQEAAEPVEEQEQDAGGYDHDHNEGEHDHEHGEEPYEWSGLFSFGEGEYIMEFQESGDPSMGLVFILAEGSRDDSDHMAYHIFEAEMEIVPADGSFEAAPDYGYQLMLNPDVTTITFSVSEPGDYLLYMEHMPVEFDLKIYDANGEELVAHDAR